MKLLSVLGFSLMLSLSMGAGGADAAQKKAKNLNQFGEMLFDAIVRNDFRSARQLLPTRDELKKVGKRYSKQQYAEFMVKRKQGFGRVVNKFRRKMKALRGRGYSCGKYRFSHLKKGRQVKKGGTMMYSRIEIFGKCVRGDKTPFWVANPDDIFNSKAGWKLLEFN
ncbi:hypothetical protein KKF84_08565 [Myxococcota bacterium]|nr:hypothetical protein [Myxococcota bacterium]